MLLSIIVAATEQNVIGAGNKLPWHIPEDLQYFKKTTMGCPIVMGRKTYDSIGRPLPGRVNIVVSRNPEWHADGVVAVASLEEALEKAEHQCKSDGVEELFVIGGEQIYRMAMKLAKKIYLTRVYLDIEGDAFFPELSDIDWRLTSMENGSESTDIQYEFMIYERR